MRNAATVIEADDILDSREGSESEAGEIATANGERGNFCHGIDSTQQMAHYSGSARRRCARHTHTHARIR